MVSETDLYHSHAQCVILASNVRKRILLLISSLRMNYSGNGNLNYEESKTHFTVWSFVKSPLLIVSHTLEVY